MQEIFLMFVGLFCLFLAFTFEGWVKTFWLVVGIVVLAWFLTGEIVDFSLKKEATRAEEDSFEKPTHFLGTPIEKHKENREKRREKPARRKPSHEADDTIYVGP